MSDQRRNEWLAAALTASMILAGIAVAASGMPEVDEVHQLRDEVAAIRVVLDAQAEVIEELGSDVDELYERTKVKPAVEFPLPPVMTMGASH